MSPIMFGLMLFFLSIMIFMFWGVSIIVSFIEKKWNLLFWRFFIFPIGVLHGIYIWFVYVVFSGDRK